MTDLLRPGDTPPSVRTEAELEAMRPDQLEAEISAHRAHAERVAAGDPGQGKPTAEATEARRKQMAAFNRHAAAAETANRILGPHPDSPEAQKERIAVAHSKLRRPGQAPPASPEMADHYRKVSLAMKEQEQAREAKRQERLQREREENPPDPRAVSVTAAVCADDGIIDALEMKPHATFVGGVDAGTQTISALEVHDLGVLVIALRLLEETRPFRCRDWAMHPHWPQRNPPVAPTKGLRESLVRPRHTGFLTIASEGSTAAIDYGPEAIRIASKWGIEIAEREPVVV